jgi:hypothetical protein
LVACNASPHPARPAYIGKLTANRIKTTWVPQQDPLTGDVTLVRKIAARDANDELLYVYPPETCPALIDEATFAQAGKLLAANREMSSRNIKRPEQALMVGGLAVCGYCGSKLAVGWDNKMNTYRYRCTRQMHRRLDMCGAPAGFQTAATVLDRDTWEWFSDQIQHPERMQAIYEQYVKHANEVGEHERSRVRAVQQTIRDARRDEEGYLSAVGSAREDYREVLVARAQEAHDRAVEAMKELEELEALVTQREQQLSLLETFSAVSLRAADKLKTASVSEKRLALRIYGVRVRVWEKGHQPYRFAWSWLGGFDPDVSSAD